MAQAPDGFMRQPKGRGFLTPLAALDVLGATAALHGDAAREALALEAQLFRLPAEDEPLREEKAARLHAAARRLHGAEAPRLLRFAGRTTGEKLLLRQMPARARAQLAAAPWPIAAWLMGRWLRLNSWTFAGSGVLSPSEVMEFEITGNPLARGERAERPICDWQSGLLEEFYARLIDPRLVCREMACAATGAPVCRFAIYREDESA